MRSPEVGLSPADTLRERPSPVKHGNQLPEKLKGRGFATLYNFFIARYDEYFGKYTTLFFEAQEIMNVIGSFSSSKII